MAPELLPLAVFLVCPTGKTSRGRPITHRLWPGIVLGHSSPQKVLGTGRTGFYPGPVASMARQWISDKRWKNKSLETLIKAAV